MDRVPYRANSAPGAVSKFTEFAPNPLFGGEILKIVLAQATQRGKIENKQIILSVWLEYWTCLVFKWWVFIWLAILFTFLMVRTIQKPYFWIALTVLCVNKIIIFFLKRSRLTAILISLVYKWSGPTLDFECWVFELPLYSMWKLENLILPPLIMHQGQHPSPFLWFGLEWTTSTWGPFHKDRELGLFHRDSSIHLHPMPAPNFYATKSFSEVGVVSEL